MDTCKVCLKKVKYILVHLRNNLNCQLDYDMAFLKEQAKDANKANKKKDYHSSKTRREVKLMRYRSKAEQERKSKEEI